jgi:sortase A
MKVPRWSPYLFFVVAAAALGYCAFVLGSAWLYQNRENRELAKLLAQSPHVAAGAKTLPEVTRDGLIGRIEIPRLKLSVMLAEGADAATLRKAIGHIEGTAFPGEPGNVGIAGHRDTFFRPLRHIRDNDLVVLETLRGRYCYRVVSTKIVRPDAVGVLAPTPHQVLTIVTCYPFYYVGAAPYRFIVRARRVNG